jgi:hypothetical protein
MNTIRIHGMDIRVSAEDIDDIQNQINNIKEMGEEPELSPQELVRKYQFVMNDSNIRIIND